MKDGKNAVDRKRPADDPTLDDARRLNDIAGADDYEAGAEQIVGPEGESRDGSCHTESAAQKLKDAFPKR